jgi:cell fate (sporulation/competence/biofilm development) regulator YlbF (YheA/YmcA/DUF963 family)
MTVAAGAAQTSYLIPTQTGVAVLPQLCKSILIAHGLTSSAALTLVQQIPFQNGLLQTLPEDQALAASHAQTFLNGWGAGVANGVFQGLNSIAEEVSALLSEALLPLANQLDTTAEADRGYSAILEQFRSGLSTLQMTTSLDQNSGSTLLAMQTLSNQVQSLSQLVADDATKLATAVTEVDRLQPIQALTDQQNSLQQKLAGLNTTIATGATDQILSSILFGLQLGAGMLGSLATGVNANAIAGGLLKIGGEAQAIVAYNQTITAQYNEQTSLIQQIGDLAKNIAADTTDMMTLSLTAAQIALFNAQLQTMVSSVSSLVSLMGSWNQQIGYLGLVSAPSTPGYFTAQVTDAQTSWSNLVTALNWYLGIIAASCSVSLRSQTQP